MIAVGVHGSKALRSLRVAAARLMVAVSLAMIALARVDFLLPGRTFWRSTLFYTMGLSSALLMLNWIPVGGILGASAFRRRVLEFGAGARAGRLRTLSENPSSGFAIVDYVVMNEGHSSIEDSRRKLECDLYYAKNYMPFLDLLNLLQTLRVVIRPEGAR